MSLRAGLVLSGRYTLVRQLGTGSTGSVWLATDARKNRVACKVLHPHLPIGAKLVQQMNTEADVLRRLSHPNITRPIEFCVDRRYVFLAMEVADGLPLSKIMAKQREHRASFAWAQVRRIFLPLCDAIAYAHGRGVVHRDLKPPNIVVNQGEGEAIQLKVLDFGLARLIESNTFDATTLGRPIGSLFYMSPEQTGGAPATERSDIFALGTVLFELVTLHRAWAWDEQSRPLPAFVGGVPSAPNPPGVVLERLAFAPRPKVEALRPGAPRALQRLIQRTMAIAPAERPSSVTELRRLVTEALPNAGGHEDLAEYTAATEFLSPPKGRIQATAVYDDARIADETQIKPAPGMTVPITARLAGRNNEPTLTGDLAEGSLPKPASPSLGAASSRRKGSAVTTWVVAIAIAAVFGALLGSLIH